MTIAYRAVLFLAAAWLGLQLGLLAGPASAQERLPVVASFSILGDLVSRVGGDRVAVETLVGPDGDAHAFQPAPGDLGRIARARLVFMNGLGFEGWMPRLVSAAGGASRLVTVSEGIAALTARHENSGDVRATDPHAWQSVPNVRRMVGAIRDALIETDPAGRAAYEANAAAYDAELAALDREIRQAVARLPEGRRRIITSHDAFGYFEAAYGIAFLAPQGVSTEAEPSARTVATLIRQIRAERIPAVFIESISDPRLIARIGEETGARIGGTLYSDALSAPGGDAATYIEMMRHNIRELATALAS